MYDVIIVGGRCAGASLGLLLARAKLKVLIVDRDSLPSDKVNSTHLLWHAGADCLNRWGLLGKLEATNCPAQRSFLLDFGPMQLRSKVDIRDCGTDAAYAPRREVLDGLLIDETRAAGVEIWDNCSVTDLLRDGNRVNGVRLNTANGEKVEVHSRLVVGADGINSTVAKLSGAKEYNTRNKTQQLYFSYFSGVDLPDVEFHARPGRMAFAWRTNDDQVVSGFCCRLEDTGTFASDMATAYWCEMDEIAPSLSRKLKAGHQEATVASAGTRGFFRTAGGQGWALTGDAGLNMDPITAAGMSNAFIQSDILSEAISKGIAEDNLDQMIVEFGKKRDEQLGPIYEFSSEMAKLDPETPEEVTQMFVGMLTSQPDIDAYFGVFAQTVPVTEFFDPTNLGRIASLADIKQ